MTKPRRTYARTRIAQSMLTVVLLLPAAAAFAAEDMSYATLQEYERLTGERITSFNEAPELRARVAAGELPPVEQRLPAEPLVLRPIEEIGQYGGAWKDLGMGARDANSNWYSMREPLIAWSQDVSHYLPNVAKAWEVSENGKAFTFHLRKGMKWSDGAPFTADDFLFWYEDIVLNDELTPVKPGWMTIGGELGKVEKIDDYTVRFSFPIPYGVFLDQLCMLMDAQFPPLPAAPKHYLKQFHPKYTPMEQVRAATEKAGFERWADFFRHRNDRIYNTPETPQVTAWVAQTTVDRPVFVMTRNPYYWKIDTRGNQLPYIDRRERILVPSLDGMAMKIIAGEFTHHHYRLGDSRQFFHVFTENQPKGNYRLVRTGLKSRGGTNFGTLFFNYHHKDPFLRELFRDKRFRMALSVAIDREEINELIFDGEAIVSQFSCGQGGGLPFWDAKLDSVHTEYDPEKANRLLDEIGLRKRDRKGFRLRPDGQHLRIVNSVFTPWPEENVDMQEMVRQYWESVGIQVLTKAVSSTLWTTQVKAAEHDIASYAACFGVMGEPPTQRSAFFPFDNGCGFAPLWGLWFNSGGREGEEPPQAVKELMTIYELIKTEISLQKRDELARRAFAIHAENLWMIGIVTPTLEYAYRLAHNDLRNESEDWLMFHYITSQFFIKR